MFFLQTKRFEFNFITFETKLCKTLIHIPMKIKSLSILFALLISGGLFAQIDNCCINPDLFNPNGICTYEYDPVVGCNGVTYSNACEATISGVSSYTNQSSGLIITNDWDCGEIQIECTSFSGITITEVGFWENPNDPCDAGECSPTGEFYGIIIDCAQWMGMPCDGEWILEDGDCCATCVETPPSDCEDISITLTNGWNMIGFSCTQNTDAISAFASIANNLVIVKDGAGNAYLPDWEFNGIGNLERGYGYLLKVSQEITDYNICE